MQMNQLNQLPAIAVIGLGYVGLPLAVEFGNVRPVLGFDINERRVAELQAGRDSTLEVSPEKLRSAAHLRFSSDPSELADCRIFIVTVPTPVDVTNTPDLTPLKRASQTVGQALKPGDLVIYESTVYPGATEEVCVPVLERFSNLTYIHSGNVDTADGGRGFHCGYSPERINPGDKVNTLTKIKKITSGSTPAIAAEVDALYASIITAGTCRASSIKVAEAAKVIENTQRDLNIATGAAPARVDVALEPFNACGQQLIRHLRASNMRRTVLGSVAMGNANPPAVKTAIYQLVHAHFTGAIDDETAIARLQAAISGPASE